MTPTFNTQEMFLAPCDVSSVWLWMPQQFQDPAMLAEFVRQFFNNLKLSRTTMVNYSHRSWKLIDYVQTYCAHEFLGIKEINWSIIIRDVRSNYQKGALKEQKSAQKNNSNECQLSRSVVKCQTK